MTMYFGGKKSIGGLGNEERLVFLVLGKPF